MSKRTARRLPNSLRLGSRIELKNNLRYGKLLLPGCRRPSDVLQHRMLPMKHRVYLSPAAVVMAAVLGACTTSSINTVRLYNSSSGETVQCGPFDGGQPQNCVAHYLTKGFMPAHP